MNSEENPLSYPSMAEYWVRIIREARDDFRTYVTDPALFRQVVTLPPESTVLDCGCGEGYLSRYLASLGHTVTGVDLSASLIEAASQLGQPEVTYRCADVCALPFADSAFDAVVSNFLLMELSDLYAAISEVARVLKPGGRFLFQILHPFCFAANGGATNDQVVSDYFQVQRHEESFVVGGEQSPCPGVRFHRPLGDYTACLRQLGFIIRDLIEPRPVATLEKLHPLWETMKESWFLLIDAEMRPNAIAV